jgi:hypothetical protein
LLSHWPILAASSMQVYDDWVERMLSDGGGVKWEEKEERAVGRCVCALPVQGS